ncbi:hypothetical protein ACJOV8_010975 [Formosa sp. 3Alg 14/1]|uniref:hypothetical protein n=1 Tax=Formosa sp. 3Alg 14/1 TaxID=3382190 RepID=UPI0039BDB5C7
MNFKIRKWLPAMVMAVAAVGALSSQAMNQEHERAALVDGYIQPSNPTEECEVSNECSTVNNGIQCTVGYVAGGTPLFKMDGNQCIEALYRP